MLRDTVDKRHPSISRVDGEKYVTVHAVTGHHLEIQRPRLRHMERPRPKSNQKNYAPRKRTIETNSGDLWNYKSIVVKMDSKDDPIISCYPGLRTKVWKLLLSSYQEIPEIVIHNCKAKM